MRNLPNFLSFSRIALSVALIFFTDKHISFAIIYLLCGISDIADGYLARRLNAESSFGAKLDSFGDLAFYLISLWLMFSFINKMVKSLIVICVIIVSIIRASNILLTKVKFKQWGIIHTFGNKLTGIVVFFFIPICILADSIPFWTIFMVGAVAILSALEESLMLVIFNDYNANRRSIFIS